MAGKSAGHGGGLALAAADPAAIGSLTPWPIPSRDADGSALAYAPVKAAVPPVRTAPMATSISRMAPEPATTVATKRSGNRPTIVASPSPPAGPAKAGQRLNNPWMRAMIVSPSAAGFMSTSLLGTPDYRALSFGWQL